MRKPFCKYGLSLVVLTAVLISILKFNTAYAETPSLDKSLALSHISHNNHVKVFSSGALAALEFTVEDGESVDDEADETDKLVCSPESIQYWSSLTDFAKVDVSTSTLVTQNRLNAKTSLPLFIVFRVFRI